VNIPSGAVSIVGADASYLRGGAFDPDRMLGWIAEQLDTALHGGFSGLRLIGEITSVWDPRLDPARLVEYEAKLDVWMAERPVSAMCVYDRTRLPASVVREMFVTHPLVVVDTILCHNEQHMSSAVLAADRPSAEVDALLDQLRASRLAHDRAQASRRELLAAQEAERAAVARELHDGFGQLLFAIQLWMHATPLDLDELDALIGEALEAVRSLAFDLRPPVLDDLGLAAALRTYLRRLARNTDLAIDLAIDDLRVPAAVATTCFRLVQEAVTNIVRHASAHSVAIEVRAGDGWLTVSVRDDGTGFDPLRPGLGIVGMTERAALAGGALEIASAPGAGTTIRARIPIGDEA
jgi:signal transduction histidine kinase